MGKQKKERGYLQPRRKNGYCTRPGEKEINTKKEGQRKTGTPFSALGGSFSTHHLSREGGKKKKWPKQKEKKGE